MHLPLVTAAEKLRQLPSLGGPLVDASARKITYLRLSITDSCNFRCVYCSPSNWAGAASLLSGDEIERLVRLFARFGVNRLRLTGGEPLGRPDVIDIARRVRVPGIEELCITTNGHRLEELAEELRAARVDTVNVSLDTLDPAEFKALSKTGDVARVTRGITKAVAVGIPRVGVNAVVMAGRNDSAKSLASLVRFALSAGAVPRFIELMPFADSGETVPTATIVERLETEGIRLSFTARRAGAGPAVYARVTDSEGLKGEVGFISPMTRNFCEGCNRIRISAKGALRACLGGRDEVALTPLIRSGASDEVIELEIRKALAGKWDRHRFVEDGGEGLLTMMGVGG